MALSGTIYKTFASYFRLQLEWSATQNLETNRSTITTKLYLVSLTNQSAIYSSTTKSAAISISASTSTESAAGMARVSPNQKKLIHSHSGTVGHNSDGTKQVDLSAYMDVNLSISGSYVGRVSLSDTVTLNTIPRASTISSSASWTAPNSLGVSISRASSSFKHTVRVYVNGTLIRTETGVGSSTTMNFTTAQNRAIFSAINGSSSKVSRVEIDTYSGSTKLNTDTKSGTCSAPSASTISAPSSFPIGGSFYMNVNRAYTDFTHIIRLKDGTTTRKSVSMSGYSIDFVTSDIASALYAATPNANSDALTLECETYYDGVQVRNTTSRSITALVKDSDPTFAGNFSFLDINSTTVGVTGNNQVLIQSHSKLRVQVTAANRALPVNGATIKEYVATMSGSSKSTGWSSSGTVTMDIGEINSPVSANISVTAIDSRGNKTTKVKRVEVIPYSSPSMSITAKRNNNFDEASTLRVTGNFSPLTVGGVNKNNVSTVYFEIRLKGTTSLIAGGGWSASNSGTSYDSGSQARSFDSDKAYDITLRVQDRIGSSSQVVTISPGKPILYLDPARNSVGVGRYPTMNDRFEVGRQMFGEKGMDLTESLNVGGELDVTGRGTMRGASILGSAKFSDDVELGYNRNWIDAAKSGIDAANSTIHNVDDFLFRSSTVRGLGFLKSGKSLNSQNESDYDFLKIKDGKGFLNGVPAFVSDSEILWNGGLMMGGSHSATPSKKMSECPNGWILVWSEYNSGIIDSLWNYFFLPKSRAGLSGGMTLVLGHKSRTHHYKYLDDITDTTIYGHSVNTQSPQNVSVLRYVLSF